MRDFRKTWQSDTCRLLDTKVNAFTAVREQEPCHSTAQTDTQGLRSALCFSAQPPPHGWLERVLAARPGQPCSLASGDMAAEVLETWECKSRTVMKIFPNAQIFLLDRKSTDRAVITKKWKKHMAERIFHRNILGFITLKNLLALREMAVHWFLRGNQAP